MNFFHKKNTVVINIVIMLPEPRGMQNIIIFMGPFMGTSMGPFMSTFMGSFMGPLSIHFGVLLQTPKMEKHTFAMT